MEPFSLQNVNILEYPKSWFENPMCAKNAMKVNFMIYLYAIAKDILQWEPISNLKQPSKEKIIINIIKKKKKKKKKILKLFFFFFKKKKKKKKKKKFFVVFFFFSSP